MIRISVLTAGLLCGMYAITTAQVTYPTQIKYESGSGSGFFGGDYREGNTARNIGNGVAITLDADTRIEQFAFSFGDFENDETGSAAEATLVYTMRNADGSIMTMREVTVPDTFTGGWVHWENIGQVVTAPGPVIITCYVKDGHENYTTGSVLGDTDAGDDASERYSCSQTSDPYDMDSWTEWYAHSWDTHYWLQGTPYNGATPPAPVFMVYQTGDGSGFFGGDYRDGNTARNIGNGVAVTLDTSTMVESFSFTFGSFENDSTEEATDATLAFTLRDTDGSPLKTGEVVVPAAFTGGWVTWSGINQVVHAPGPVIVTSYVKNGNVNYTTGSVLGDTDAGDDASVRYACSQSDEPYDMDTWSEWYEHSWDTFYKLEGRAVMSGISDILAVHEALPVLTVTPNPFIHGTTVQAAGNTAIDQLVVYARDGSVVRRITGGTNRITWDGTDAAGMPAEPGTYVGIAVKNGQSARTGIIVKK